MFKRFRNFIQENQLITPNDSIVAAVSGGADSMAMLHLLQELSTKLALNLSVLHINHGVRGAESDADEKLVEIYCDKNNLSFQSHHLSGLDKNSTEDQMRQARYAVFEKVLKETPHAKIATAHHLNDQFETFLMRLAKGASLNGLTGIPLKRQQYIRPMLLFERKEIEFYIEKNKIPFREDKSNSDTTKLRNNIRHNLMPQFDQVFGATFLQNFNQSNNRLSKFAEFFAQEAEAKFNLICKKKTNEIVLPIVKYLELPELLRMAIFQSCVSELNHLNSKVSEDFWDSFDRYAKSAVSGSKFICGDTVFVLKNRNELLFYTEELQELPVLELYPEKDVYWGQFKISLNEALQEEVILDADGNQEYFCADEVSFPLTVRSWQESDFFYPFGMKGKKKLSDFFIDQKVDRNQKKQIPIIRDLEKIVWIAGMRLDNRYKITNKTKKIYKLTIENKGSK